ncbi:MAG: CDP-glycerol glycerophosphotransferase family protein [Methanobrevibacter sp.]|jgi:CDP-glycerol glycerophosphotransferase|nr:CDP-glycerol glycerophosphotransferase family protein [Candidatus Methanoflexus mossambicus]
MFKKFVKSLIIPFYKVFFKFLSTKKNIIVFESGNGRNYTGNPKYVYEYILDNVDTDKYKLIWSLEDLSIDIPGKVIKVKKNRIKYFYFTAIAQYWVFDTRPPIHLLKKDSCIFIQTWHGTPLKKLGLDMEMVNMGTQTNIEEYKHLFEENSKHWDVLLSQNPYSSKIFKRAFNFNGKMLEIAYPRNDILTTGNSEEFIEELKNSLNLPKNKKIILYAPTWRDNEFYKNGDYKFVTEIDFKLLEKELSDEYCIIVKYHYLIKEKENWEDFNNFVFVANDLTDIQLLYLASDILLTDYSSVMFDYSILKRPIIFYTYDLENYKENIRDFYFNMENNVPGPLIKDNNDLINYFKNFNEDAYFNEFGDKYQEFIDKFIPWDDGNSSKMLVDFMDLNL